MENQVGGFTEIIKDKVGTRIDIVVRKTSGVEICKTRRRTKIGMCLPMIFHA